MTAFHSVDGSLQQPEMFSPISPIDSSLQWNYADVYSPKNMVSHYNNLLQRAADFYATLDHSFNGVPSSGSDGSYRSSPERRASSTSTVVAQVKSSIPDKIERRRKQNRSSQRAYRERKERHQKDLEAQIADWHQKRQQLSRSYSQQTKEVARLKGQIEQLNNEISQLQSGLPTLCGSISPQEFDLVPFFEADNWSPESTPQLSHASPSRRGS